MTLPCCLFNLFILLSLTSSWRSKVHSWEHFLNFKHKMLMWFGSPESCTVRNSDDSLFTFWYHSCGFIVLSYLSSDIFCKVKSPNLPKLIQKQFHSSLKSFPTSPLSFWRWDDQYQTLHSQHHGVTVGLCSSRVLLIFFSCFLPVMLNSQFVNLTTTDVFRESSILTPRPFTWTFWKSFLHRITCIFSPYVLGHINGHQRWNSISQTGI